MARKGRRVPGVGKVSAVGGFLTSASRPPPKVNKRSGYKDPTDWAKSGRWVSVISSTVAGLMYDADEETLFVQFRGGEVYQYLSVPLRVAADFFSANSMGKYLDRRIKKVGYIYAKIQHVVPKYKPKSYWERESNRKDTASQMDKSSRSTANRNV